MNNESGLNESGLRTYVCKRARMCSFLRERGFEPYKVTPDRDNPMYDVFLFTASPELYQAVMEYINTSENKCTSDSEIHDSNNQMADEVDDLCEYLNCCEEVTPEVAICVKGGLVSSVYANANMDVDVYDLDVSDFPDEGEQEAADQKEAELDELVKSPGWRAVW